MKNDDGEEVELRHCPFCKINDVEILTGGKRSRCANAYCHSCGCTLASQDSEAESAAAWNHRPVEDEAISLLRELASEKYDEQSLIRRANNFLAIHGKWTK